MTFKMECLGNAAEGCFLVGEGLITKDTPDAFVRAANQGGLDGGQVLLNSPGGSLGAGLKLGRLIRQYNLFTVVGDPKALRAREDLPSGGICESACAYAFLGGIKRTLTEGAKLGFHQMSLDPEQSKKLARAGALMADVQRLSGESISYIVEMGIDARIFTLAASAEGKKMYYPPREVAEDFGLITPFGYAPFIMEPYGKGVVAAAKRNTPTGPYDAVYQVTTFCSKGRNKLLFTAGFAPKRSVDFHLTLDGTTFTIPPARVSTRSNETTGYLEVVLNDREMKALTRATKVQSYFEYSRAEGWGFPARLELSDLDRKMIGASYRLCL